MNTHNREGASGVGTPYAIFKVAYKAETEEVMIETTLTHSGAVETAMLQTARLKDRAVLEALPDEVLKSLYNAVGTELHKRTKYTAVLIDLDGWDSSELVTYLTQEYGESYFVKELDVFIKLGVFVIKGNPTVKEGNHTISTAQHHAKSMMIRNAYASDRDGQPIGSERK